MAKRPATTAKPASARPRVPITKARATLGAILRRVEMGEEIEITRRGVPVAVIEPDPRATERRAERFRALVARLLADPILRRADGDGPDDPWAEVRDRSPGRPPPDFG